MKKIIELDGTGMIPVMDIDAMDVGEADEVIGLMGKFLFTNSLKKLDLLNKYEIKSLLTTEEVDKKIVKDLEFPVVQVKEGYIQDIIEGIKAIRPENLERELRKAKKEGLLEWLEKYRRRSF